MSHTMLHELQQTKPFAHAEEELYLSLIRTADKLSRHLNEVFKTVGISSAQYNVMRILRGAGEAGLPCGEISARLITRDPDVTRLLDRLATRKLVERGRSKDDRRVVSARITEAGLALLAELDAPVLNAQKRLFDFLTQDDLAHMLDLLTRVRRNLG